MKPATTQNVIARNEAISPSETPTLKPKLRFKEFEGEWQSSNIGNVLKIGSGRDYKHLNHGEIPVYGTGGFMTYVDEYLYDGESVCIGRKGTIDKPVYLNEKFWTVDTLFYTHSFIHSIPKFIFGIFETINWKLYNEASGVPSLSKRTIEKLKFNLPTLPEQQKIATFLTAIDTKIQQLTTKKATLAQYKKGVMQQLFSQQLRFKPDNVTNPTVTARYEAVSQNKAVSSIEADSQNAFPDWEEKKLGSFAKFYKGKGLPKSEIKENGEYKCIHYGELFTKYKESIKAILSRTNIKDKRFVSKANDILMPTSDVTPNGLATASCINEDDVILGGDVLIIRQSKMILDGVYFSYYISNNKKGVMRLVSGSTVYHLYGSDVKTLSLLLPSLKEQQKIANYLSAIDSKIEAVQTQITKTQQFKKGLLQQMFV